MKTLFGSLECEKSLFIIVIPGLLLNFGVNYSIFLALHPVPPMHFTLSNRQSECTNYKFKQILYAHIYNKPLSACLNALPFTEFSINCTISQSIVYSPFFMLYGQEIPLPFNHALSNQSDNTTQPATIS